MQEIQSKDEIKVKIADLRQRYTRLRAICGHQGISQETIAEYTKAIQKLQTQLT